MNAGELVPGDEVFTAAGGWLRLTANTVVQERATVYNFTVADFHTYFVGEVGAWVHNVSRCPIAPKPGGKRFTSEQQVLVDMAKADKHRGGITKGDMQAFKDLNKEAGAKGFTQKGAVRGSEAHLLRSPKSKPGPGQKPHGHVGPVKHIPIKDR